MTNFIPDLSNADLEYICTAIPSTMIASYFTRHPKDFQKIRPGFRAKSLKQEELSRILFDHCDSPFIGHFINDAIQNFLEQIDDHYNSCIDAGESRAQAYLHTLSKSYFRDNIPLYLQLSGRDDLTDEAVEYIVAALNLEENWQKQRKAKEPSQEKKDRALAEAEKKLQTREKELSRLYDRMSKTEQERSRLAEENKSIRAELAERCKQLTQVESVLSEAETEIKRCKVRVDEVEQRQALLQGELSAEKLHVQELETELTELREKEADRQAQQKSLSMVYAPKDIDEFCEFLDYNLTDIGISNSEPYKELLVKYLGKILFLGMPILANHGVAHSIAQCVSNALTGTKAFDTLIYHDSISDGEIREFFDIAGRVVCLDGFVGNFNELVLLPIIKAYRDRIVFLTTVSERTVMCLATDFMLHCVYFNGNRTGILLRPCSTSEDGTTIEEYPVEAATYPADERAQRIFVQIASECQIPLSLVDHWKLEIVSEEDLCQVLAFTALPYCADSMYLRPYSVSQRLQKYAGQAGKCPHKDLLIRWFGR